MRRGALERYLVAGVGLLAVVGLSTMMMHASSAAFTATTSTDPNSWATGTLQLDNTLTETFVFAESGLVPGDVVERCAVITYTGDTGETAVDIRMYGDATVASHTNDLAADLLVDVTSASGDHSAGDGACASSYDTQTIETDPALPKSLASFATDHSSWGQALGLTWLQTGNGVRTYRIQVRLDETSTKTGSTASYGFHWEARTP